MYGIPYNIGETVDVLRRAQPYRHMEYLLGQFDGAFHLRAASGDHNAGGDQLLETTAAQFIANQSEQFLESRFYDLGQRLPRKPSRRPLTNARHLYRLVRVGEL